MKISTFLLFLSSIFILSSCEKEGAISENSAPQISANINGSQKTLHNAGVSTLKHGTEIIFGFEDPVVIFLEDFTVGTVKFGDNTFNEVKIQFVDTKKNYSSYISNTEAGSFTISEIDEVNNTLSGTFEFKIPNVLNENIFYEVTSGSFENIPFRTDLDSEKAESKLYFETNNESNFSWQNVNTLNREKYGILFTSSKSDRLILDFPDDLPLGKTDLKDLEDFEIDYLSSNHVIDSDGFIDVLQNDNEKLVIDFEFTATRDSGEVVIFKTGHLELFK